MRENPASGFVSNWRISDEFAVVPYTTDRQPNYDSVGKVVSGRKRAKSARRRGAQRLAEMLAIERFDKEPIQARRKHGLAAVIGLCVGCERNHVGFRIADERFRRWPMTEPGEEGLRQKRVDVVVLCDQMEGPLLPAEASAASEADRPHKNSWRTNFRLCLQRPD